MGLAATSSTTQPSTELPTSKFCARASAILVYQCEEGHLHYQASQILLHSPELLQYLHHLQQTCFSLLLLLRPEAMFPPSKEWTHALAVAHVGAQELEPFLKIPSQTLYSSVHLPPILLPRMSAIAVGQSLPSLRCQVK